MNVAVMSLTRDRLDYTRHCFGTLLDNAGCDFDWWIADNGSTDGTADWLIGHTDATVTVYEANAGICPALNEMLDDIVASADYDVIVKLDNDCELLTPNTLRDICEHAVEYDRIVSPWIRGLRHPPLAYANDAGFAQMYVVGGIFMAVPARVFADCGYRHPLIPTLDGDDWQLCRWWRSNGGELGYLDGYEANHYETTNGQHARYPEYFARREREREDARMMFA